MKPCWRLGNNKDEQEKRGNHDESHSDRIESTRLTDHVPEIVLDVVKRYDESGVFQ